jgi:DNA-binding NarL/FixJ family response regulator
MSASGWADVRLGLGIALRAVGLAERGEQGLDSLRAAVNVLERSEAKLERARALIDLGAALHLSRRRERPREPLRRALDLAHRCGAHPLEDRADAELLATRARPRRREPTGLDALTDSERRVAQLAGQGLSTRQIAQSLFISMKTVAVHLTHTYQWLGVAGRADLVDVVERSPPARDAAPSVGPAALGSVDVRAASRVRWAAGTFPRERPALIEVELGSGQRAGGLDWR